MNINWHGDEVMASVKSEAVKFITKAVIMGEAQTKRIMGQEPSPSRAGHPPAVVTGRYRASIGHEVDAANLVARWGSNLKVGRGHEHALGAILELGTEKMAPRQHYRPTLAWLIGQLK